MTHSARDQCPAWRAEGQAHRSITPGLLVVLFGQLTKRVPNSDGGLYAYARHEFGDFAG